MKCDPLGTKCGTCAACTYDAFMGIAPMTRTERQIAILEARIQDLYRDIAALRAMAKGAKR